MEFHVVLPMLHRALVVDGRLLIWRNVFGDASADVTPFRRDIQRIVERRGAPPEQSAEDVGVTAEQVAASGLFSIDDIHHYHWTVTLTTDQVRGLFRTFSNWTTAEVDEAASAVTALGGTVSEHYTSWLITASPKTELRQAAS